MNDEEKLVKFNESFVKLTGITVETVTNAIVQIQVGDQIVVDRKHIEEFIANADREFYTAIVNLLEVERNKFVLEPIKMDATEVELKQGANSHYEVPLSFDQSNFFA